jgi:hypothetical protein
LEGDLNMSAQYWIAQYVPDVFRNEPRNIGVFVAVGNDRSGRFIGEDDDQIVDGRKLRGYAYPDVVRQWIAYWRRELINGNIELLPKQKSANFRVIEGGVVEDIGMDGASKVAAYLYAMLISDGGLKEAILVDAGAAEPQPAQLDTEIASALDNIHILGSDQKDPAPHPVQRQAPVAGRILPLYKPAFVQRNGLLYVMETVDFTKPHKRAARDHAGWSACMYKDVADANPGAVTSTIVRVTEEDQRIEEVAHGLALLRNVGNVVNWLDSQQRDEFVRERREVAFHVN